MEIKLKPCPFCGGIANFVKLNRNSYRFAVQCQRCDAVTGGSAFENNQYNAEIWNRRHNSADARGE